MSSSISLHKFGISPDDECNHVFTFIWENPQRICEQVKSVESSEVNYGGHRWSVVVMRKEERFVGIYLKWKYSDGQSASSVCCKVKYQLALLHRLDYSENKYFNSNQRFTTSQSLLGRSKFISLDRLLDLGEGYLDETGKRVVLELAISKSMTRFEKRIDTSPRNRTKKNASGFYFDTTTFLLSGQRWYLRVYPSKSNSHGLPSVYLYMSSKPKELSLEVSFKLYIQDDTTELLAYNYGEGAKFDGFGKTLSQALPNVEKMTELTIGVEIHTLLIWKDHVVSLRQHNNNFYSPQTTYKDYNYNKGSGSWQASNSIFADHEGNAWKIEPDLSQNKLTMILDKGVHHYQMNKTKLLCWSLTLLSRDPDRANDLEMCGEPIVGYFSNFIDEKGYRVVFPVEMLELDERQNPFASDSGGEIMLRINLLSLQTVPVGMRSIPRFEYQTKHLLRARRMLQERTRSLEDMRDMAASRASLSLLDLSRDETINSVISETSSNEPSTPHKQHYKSYESLDALSNHELGAEDDCARGFVGDILRHLASPGTPSESTEPVITARDSYNGTREDVSTESGITVSDESSLMNEARPSPVDLGKQREVVNTISKLLQQRLPLRISEIVEMGSLGCGTTTRSRMDVDLVIVSSDVPRDSSPASLAAWLPGLLQALQSLIQQATSNPDPFLPLPRCSCFTQTAHSLQFTCGFVDVDVSFTHDWDSNDSGGMQALYRATRLQSSTRQRQWLALGASKLQKKFIVDQPNEVKEVIKVVKHWRNCVQWKKAFHRPNSYLISLLVIRAVESLNGVVDIKRVIASFTELVQQHELSIQWSIYYSSEKYPGEFEPPCPLVRDPANPGYNVATSLPYWGQFRAEVALWCRALAIDSDA